MFEVRSKLSFASEAFLASQGNDSAYKGTMPELWVPDKAQQSVLTESNYSCSCCGLRSSPGLIDLNSSSVTKIFVDSAIKIHNLQPTKDTKNIAVPSGLMDIFTNNNGSHTVLCWICRTSMCPSLSVAAVYDHGVAIYAPGVSQARISSLFATCSFAIIPLDSPLSVEAENTLLRIRAALVPPVSEVIPGIMNGSIEGISEMIEYMPSSISERMADHIDELRYLPSSQAYKTHLGYWFAVSQNGNEDFQAALNG